MLIFKTAKDISHWVDIQAKNGKNTGFTPTMGALHSGHISLINTSAQENKITVCSIFVNPTQFNDPNDYEKYPVTIEKDIKMLEKANCDALFLPGLKEIYPNGLAQKFHYALGYLEKRLEGEYRPGHYQGVCMVVHRLLGIVTPDNLYLGQKDYQQCMVIKKLIEITGKSERINIRVCPTLREKDGLAMSSRNVRLSSGERDKAVAIFTALEFIKKNIKPGILAALLSDAGQILINKGFRIDYLEITDAYNLSRVDFWDGHQKITALAAAYLNDVRLIDNMILN
ncbi:MAG: pantoate--beta-alanine ligase [Chitinophagaceae bacterium]|nr:pantoate--beta-alanine ligase [Chitinophagaceae bacterium]